MPPIDQSKYAYPQVHLPGASPSPAAEEELFWFFNEAEAAIDQPSTYYPMLRRETALSLEEVEARQEALHAASKIKARLEALSVADALLLAGLYTERPWSERVERALGSGCLAGALVVSASFRAAYMTAVVRGVTKANSAAAWLEEVVRAGGPAAVSAWRQEVERACAHAVRAYERARGEGPSVVPQEEEVG